MVDPEAHGIVAVERAFVLGTKLSVMNTGSEVQAE
jgi:hypothetical protein